MRNLSGGALIYAIVVSIFITIFLLIYMNYQLMERKYESSVIDDYLLKSSLESALIFASSRNDLVNEELSLNGIKGLNVSSCYWGLYKLCKAHIQFKGKDVFVANLYGLKKKNDLIPTLYIQDRGQLITMDSTRIDGNLYIGQSGYKFVNSERLTSQIKLSRSKTTLEKSDIDFINIVEAAIKGGQKLVLKGADKVDNGFSDSTIVLFSDNTINLSGVELKGNVIVFSKSMVIINSSSKLDGVLIYSPKVQIESGFHGKCQVFADDTIIVESKVILDYPSSIVIDTKTNIDGPYIELNEGDSIFGDMVMTDRLNDNGIVRIKKDAYVNGLVFCSSRLNNNGYISGSVYVDQLVNIDPYRASTNYIKNAVISNTDLSKDYLFSYWLNSGEPNELSKYK